MSDFDFDELDKAVTGALGNDATPSQPDMPKQAEPVTPESTPVQVAPISDSVRQTTPPAIRRASGRFMDVVHPSSDMRSSRPTGQQSESPTASRQPSTMGGFTPPETNHADMFTKLAEPQQEETASIADVQDDDASAVGEWSKPLESPFLPDTKVEKRPLGGSADTETFASMLEETSKEPLLEAPDEPRLEATTMPDPIDFANQSMALPFENEDTGELKTQETPALLEEHPLELIEPDEEVTKLSAPSAPEPTGPTSITQQYTEQASAVQPSGAIYDTENYHQPLAHEGKKHSSVWTILGIILLVVLGAGAGVAFYFLVLQNF
jgi:hypothetical protein